MDITKKTTENSITGQLKEQQLSNKKLALALSGIMLSILLSALDQTIVNPALPRIVEELQGFSLFAWVSTAYLLTVTATIPIAGKLGDMFGRKILLITGVFVFLIGSALSGAAPSMFWLVMFRGLQGVGAGILQASAFAMVAELFPDAAKRARWQGFIAATFGLASLIGPTLGGYITDNLVWRWVFYVNLPVGALAVVALIVTLPNSHATGKRKIDWWGAFFSTGAVVSLLLALTWGGKSEPSGYAWLSPQILGLFGLSLVLTALFLYTESRVTEPIIPLHLFKNKTVSLVNLLAMIMGAIMLGATLYIPLFVQVVLGQSASTSGAVNTPIALAMVTANILTGQYIGRIGILKVPLISGAITTLVGLLLLTTIDVNTSMWIVSLYMIVVGLGLGQVMPSMTIAVQESVSRKELGVGISTVQFSRSIGSTIGVAVIGTVVTNAYLSDIQTASATSKLPQKIFEAIQEPQNLLNKQVSSILPPDVIAAVQHSLSGAIHFGFVLSAVIAIVAVITAILIPSIRVKNNLKKKTIEESASAETYQTQIEAAVR